MFNFAAPKARMNQNAEEKIKQAALRVFIQKGSANCSSREIAREAGMNVALVNYYFRSKSKLFALIFETVMQDFLKSMVQVFSSDLPIREKIKILIEREFEFLGQHPDIPNFVLNELARAFPLSIATVLAAKSSGLLVMSCKELKNLPIKVPKSLSSGNNIFSKLFKFFTKLSSLL